MKPTLLALAAGMGSRYGGLKQLDTLGPNGETILDYSIYDAVQAGFGKVVFIVRDSFRAQFEQLVEKKYGNYRCPDGEKLQFCFVSQELDKIPAGYEINPERVKPWGTAHAVLMAKNVIKEPFAVINGDDYYGRESFAVLGKWLSQHSDTKGEYCIVGFELQNTLSENGSVSRGICSYDQKRNLTSVVEHLEVIKEDGGKIFGVNSNTKEKVEIKGHDLCSMNMWGFTPDYFDYCEKAFADFLAQFGTELKKEFYIPYVIDCLINAGTASTTVLGTDSKWFGVTFPEDRPGVVAKFAELVKKGIYPSPLY